MRTQILVMMAVFAGVHALGISAVSAQGPKAGVQSAPRVPMGTEFTYQGRLLKNGTPVDGVTCNFQFTLYDSVTDATPIGSPASPSAPVNQGVFTVQLDFGASAFTGDSRWLEISAMCPGDGGWTLLTPRQQLRPSPYALFAQSAASTNALQGRAVSATAPSLNQALMWTGSAWAPTTLPAAGSAWSLLGNVGTNPSANYIGTMDNAALVLKVYGTRALRLEPTGNTPNVIGGSQANTVSGGSFAATIAGGGFSSSPNQVSATYGSIGGGIGNVITGTGGTIPGGSNNSVGGANSLAAGSHANAKHEGSFVWNNSPDTDFSTTANNQFLIRASGGMGVNTNSPAANSLTVNGRVVSYGTAFGEAAFVAKGPYSGIKMDDRSGALNTWQIFPNNSELRFTSTLNGEAVRFDGWGRILAYGGFSGQCLSGTDAFSISSSNSCNMDFAESFAARELTQPGDVVTLVAHDTSEPTVARSTLPYQTTLVGVVSTNPGLVFDDGETHIAGNNTQLITADKTVVALAGRVPVRVSMENGSIAAGDPLTSSSQPGAAMKATRAGKIIGYAMETKESDGKVLVLIQPGYFMPEEQVATQQQTAALQKQNADLEARVTALEQAAAANLSAQARSEGIPTNWLVFAGLAFVGYAVLERRRNGART